MHVRRIHPLIIGHLHGRWHASHIPRVEIVTLLTALHLIMHAIVRTRHMLWHLWACVRIIGPLAHGVHESTSIHALVRLRDAAVRTEVHTLIHHRLLVILVWATCSGIHPIHVVLACVEPICLVLALYEHLSCLH